MLRSETEGTFRGSREFYLKILFFAGSEVTVLLSLCLVYRLTTKKNINIIKKSVLIDEKVIFQSNIASERQQVRFSVCYYIQLMDIDTFKLVFRHCNLIIFLIFSLAYLGVHIGILAGLFGLFCIWICSVFPFS